jgi:predicted nucleic acid-binding protein
MRLVLDTNVVISALLWCEAPYQLLTHIRDRAESISLYCSAPLLAELADVLTRPAAANSSPSSSAQPPRCWPTTQRLLRS